jgi:hypothetical protein
VANPFEDLIPAGQTSAAPITLGTPRPRQPAPVRPVQEEMDQQQLVNARLEEERKRQDIAEAARRAATPNQGKPAKPLPEAAMAKLEEQVSALSGFERAINLFNDDFSGGGASIENTLQGYIGLGTPGQRDWWSDFKANDMRLRNAMFGASLTPGEQAAWEGVTVSENMAPKEIRANMARRQKLAREILARRARAYKAGPYDQEMIAAVLGEYDPDLPQSQPQPTPLKLPSGGSGELNVTITDERQPGESEEDYQRRIATEGGLPPPPPTPPPSDQGIVSQLGRSTVNTVAGLGQGAAAIVDIPARALGSLMAVPADVLGFDDVAASWRNPGTIGGEIEKLAPTPEDWTGWSTRQLAGLAGGGLTFGPKAAGALTNMIAGKVPSAPSALVGLASRPGNLAKDMADLNMTPRPALTGGSGARILSAISEATPVGSFLHARSASKLTDEASSALSGIAAREGRVINAEAAGELATKGALGYRSTSRNAISRLYDRAASIAEGVKVVPDKTVQALDRHIAELGENPAADSSLPYLTKLRDRLVNDFSDGVTVQGLRGMRTSLRDQFYKEGLRGTDIERRVMEAVDSVSDDLATSLGTAGKSEAATLFRQADAAWAERVDTLDNIIMPIIGKKHDKTGEQVYRALEQTAKSGGVKLKRFLASLPDEEAQTTRASLIEGLGRSSAGSTGEFSLADFATRWRSMSPTAKDAFFTTDARQSIEKLARVAERAKKAGRYLNATRSGAVAIGAGTVATALDSIGTLGITLGTQAAAGLLLTNPSVAKALGGFAAASTRSEAAVAIRQLGAAAKRNPALADQILDLETRLMSALNDAGPATGKLAASPNERPEK